MDVVEREQHACRSAVASMSKEVGAKPSEPELSTAQYVQNRTGQCRCGGSSLGPHQLASHFIATVGIGGLSTVQAASARTKTASCPAYLSSRFAMLPCVYAGSAMLSTQG
jgi:hypothetical protein